MGASKFLGCLEEACRCWNVDIGSWGLNRQRAAGRVANRRLLIVAIVLFLSLKEERLHGSVLKCFEVDSGVRNLGKAARGGLTHARQERFPITSRLFVYFTDRKLLMMHLEIFNL